MGAVTEPQVLDALRTVIDPELGVNIVDLGLVYSVDIAPRRIHVALTMTTRTCPLGGLILEQALAAVDRIAAPDIVVDVELVWDPPWSPAMMSEAARRQLG